MWLEDGWKCSVDHLVLSVCGCSTLIPNHTGLLSTCEASGGWEGKERFLSMRNTWTWFLNFTLIYLKPHAHTPPHCILLPAGQPLNTPSPVWALPRSHSLTCTEQTATALSCACADRRGLFESAMSRTFICNRKSFHLFHRCSKRSAE